MAVRVERGVLSRMLDRRDGFVLQVLRADDPEAVIRGLERAAREIVKLGPGPNRALGLSAGDYAGPKYVSDVMPSAKGPIVLVDASHSPDRYLKETLEIICPRLEEAGVDDAVITIPKPDERLIYRPAPAVVLHLALRPMDHMRPEPIPGGWIEAGIAWVQEQDNLGEAWVTRGFPFPIELEAAPRLFERFRQQPSQTTLDAGGLSLEPSGRLAHDGPESRHERFLRRAGMPLSTFRASYLAWTRILVLYPQPEGARASLGRSPGCRPLGPSPPLLGPAALFGEFGESRLEFFGGARALGGPEGLPA